MKKNWLQVVKIHNSDHIVVDYKILRQNIPTQQRNKMWSVNNKIIKLMTGTGMTKNVFFQAKSILSYSPSAKV